jgi:hypothetical protein
MRREDMKSMGKSGRGKRYAGLTAALMLSILLPLSCATTKPKELERAGIKGEVIPVDSNGEEIGMEDKEEIIVNCIPIREGIQLVDRTVTENAKKNGEFNVELRGGDFVVEIFLEGFYVETFYVTLDKNRRKNLGKVEIERIETGSGKPIKDEAIEDVITNEGDVNIQPPPQ